DLDVSALAGELARLTTDGMALIEASQAAFTARDTLVEFDMSYVGQTHTVSVPLAEKLDHAAIRAAFEARYRAAYGRLLEGIAMRVLNLRGAVVGRRLKPALRRLAPTPGGNVAAAKRGARRIFVNGGFVEAPVYTRLDLPAGTTIAGPAILEQPDT